jgi:hypothetical protein
MLAGLDRTGPVLSASNIISLCVASLDGLGKLRQISSNNSMLNNSETPESDTNLVATRLLPTIKHNAEHF